MNEMNGRAWFYNSVVKSMAITRANGEVLEVHDLDETDMEKGDTLTVVYSQRGGSQ